MDSSRRNVIVSTPSFIAKKETCIHTKNVFSLLDLGVEDENFIKIKKHMDSCSVCENAFSDFEQKTFESKVYIPKPQIDLETKSVFENEVHELFKVFDLNEKARLRKKIKSNFKKLDMAGIDFIKNLSSKNMLKTYAFGAVLFVILRQFFN